MREIVPYKTVSGAKRALDNGGRFYNLFTKAGDDLVESAELARAAGVVGADAKAYLYFEMALMALPPEERRQVMALFPPELAARYEASRPRLLLPSMVERDAAEGELAVVSGYPRFVEDRTQFTGMIVMVVPVVMMIPIMDTYDVYEVFDTAGMRGRRTVIATTRGSKRLDGGHWRFGGVLKELEFEDKTGKDHGLFLDTAYYTEL